MKTGLAEFWSEAALVAKLRPHTNIVQFLGVCSNPFCAVYEFMAGGDLWSYLKNDDHKVTDALRLKWIQGIASGMYHLSREKVVHRDLAARNVLLSEETLIAKVADFGMSRNTTDSGSHHSISTVGPLKWMVKKWEKRKKTNVFLCHNFVLCVGS